MYIKIEQYETDKSQFYIEIYPWIDSDFFQEILSLTAEEIGQLLGGN